MTYTGCCPVCGRTYTTHIDDTDLGLDGIDDADDIAVPCLECMDAAIRTRWSRVIFDARWAARKRRWPALDGSDAGDVDAAYVLRDAAVRELQLRLDGLAFTQEECEQIVNGFVCEHTDAAFWLTVECPAEPLLRELGA